MRVYANGWAGRSTIEEGVDRGRKVKAMGFTAAKFDPFPGPWRSFVDRRTRETTHQLYVTDSYFGAERGWNAARDNAGAPLAFIAIGQDEITCDAGCSYVEEFAAKLPESALRASPDELAVTFSSRSGDEKTIVVPAEQLTAQLAAIDARRTPAQPIAASGTTSP